QATYDADGEARDRFILPCGSVKQVQTADTILIGEESDGAAVGRELKRDHVPLDVVGEGGVLLGGEVDVGQALEFGTLVGRDVEAFAVFAETRVAVSDLFRTALRREERLLPRRRVDEPDVAF